jgi:hypothetical protein
MVLEVSLFIELTFPQVVLRRESINRFWKVLESFGKFIFGPLGYGKVMDFL